MRVGNVIPIKKHEAVEIPVNNITVREFFFPDVQNLRDKKIQGIEFFYTNQIDLTPFGRSGVGTLVFKGGYVTFVNSNDQEDIIIMPLKDLLSQENDGQLAWFDNKILDLTKCFVTVGRTNDLQLNTAFLFSFYYED